RPMQVSTAEFKKGLRIVFDGQPYAIVDFQHVKPGKGGAFVRTKLKHMRLGKVIDNTFRAGEKVDLVEYDEKHMQFLYKDERYHFMDMETYEQVSLSADEVGVAREYLKESTADDVLSIVAAQADELGLSEIEVESAGTRLRVQRAGAPATPAVHAGAAPSTSALSPTIESALVADVAAPTAITIEAPMVGTFYRASAPTADP